MPVPPYRPLGMNVLYYETDGDGSKAGSMSGAGPSSGWRPLPLQQLSAELGALRAKPAPSPMGGEQWDRQAFIFAEDAAEAPLPVDPATVAAAATGRGEAPAPADHTAATTTVQMAKKDVKENKHEHPNVDVLARQVYAVIRQRLAVERERTGRRDRW